jgi:hypothetical protein
MEMRLYLANFDADFHDLRASTTTNERYHDPVSYQSSQQLAQQLLQEQSPGVIYRSVRHPGGECVACFRPRLVQRVRAAGHFEYLWTGSSTPSIRKI